MLTRSSYHRIRGRRHVVFGAGFVALLLTATSAIALGSGCIFDEGDYKGGGRRTSAPTSTESTETSPNVPSPPTNSDEPAPTPVTTPPDSGATDVDARDG